LHAEEHGAKEASDAPQQLGAGVGLDGIAVLRFVRQGAGQALEQGPVRLEAALGPRAPTDGDDPHHATARRRRQAGGLRDLELRHPSQLLVSHANDGVDVGLGLAFGREQDGDLAGDVPAHGTLAAEELGQVAEDRKLLERVPGWTFFGHGGIVGPVPSIAVIGRDSLVARRVLQKLQAAGAVAASDGRAAAGAATVVQLDGDGSDAHLLLGPHTAVRTFVYASTAMVYGAWPNNPVPLTEDAPLRPNPGFAYAVSRAEAERVALEWREATDGARLAVLRPATVLADVTDRLSRLMRDVLPSGVGEDIPPVQYLHGDDLADAVILAVTAGLDGVFNVAPDGWMSADEARALTAGPLRVRLPRRLRLLRPDVPSELMPYLVHPWVVANDRLRAAGWRPRYTSEEAFVAGAGVPGWQSLSLGRRQALALGGAAGVLGAAIAGGVALSRRRKR